LSEAFVNVVGKNLDKKERTTIGLAWERWRNLLFFCRSMVRQVLKGNKEEGRTGQGGRTGVMIHM